MQQQIISTNASEAWYVIDGRFVASLGGAIGPLVGGWLYDRAGHAVPFYLNAAVLVVGAILVVFLLKPSSRAATETVDPR